MQSLRRIAITVGKSTSLFSTSSSCLQNVTILGAAGGIGQPLSLLLKQSLFVTNLSLYDVNNADGIAADLSHIDTRPNVSGHSGPSELASALSGANVVLIPAGVPRKPGMTRDDLFTTNASVVADLTHACAKHCPDAMICIITNPVNSTVPIAAEILRKAGVFDPRRLFGVTTLDIIRSNTFISQKSGLDVNHIQCPVIGGHSGVTIVPLISHCTPPVSFHPAERAALTERIQNAGTEIVNAKAGAGSATLSMAYAGARFANSLLQAMKGCEDIVECCFVQSDVGGESEFFASPVHLGPSGVQRVLTLGKLKSYEVEILKLAMPELLKNIKKGKDFAAHYAPK